MPLVLVDDRFVDLVAEQQQVVADDEVGDVPQLRFAEHRADRVPRRIQHQRPRSWRHRRLERVAREDEAVLHEGRADTLNDAAGQPDRRLIGVIHGIRQQDAVAVGNRRHQGRLDAKRRAGGDEDLGRRVVVEAVVSRQLQRDGVAQAFFAAVVRVGGPARFERRPGTRR